MTDRKGAFQSIVLQITRALVNTNNPIQMLILWMAKELNKGTKKETYGNAL